MENEIEVWKDMPNYEGIYQISTFGNVKSLKFGKSKILKNSLDFQGYYRVLLFKNNKSKVFKVHQLVAICFLNHKPCGSKLVVNHKDKNKLNNNIDNLEVVTKRENTSYRNHSSKYVGVSYHKHTKKWKSYIRINGKIIFLGYFINEIDASNAYQKALKEITVLN